ncbi:hypothetical protein B0H17DRAFT_615314 [Mycena rosella]|uniref:Inner centromere protein ARK-binding domain-containing protein n=1 Tax=Mycena rosella TaxID=1033263 RepID=A0AAD7GVK8_MYCRO|nr:hypothetical protein B0H17DRAFT_615314 [Mycena rosella]
MEPGLLEWCNSTRFTMANDPGRQLLQDQIQTHGFLFLTDYLDNILAGPRRDPLIELVKTPGRKKATNKRPVATTSALKSVVTVSLEDENDSGSKENTAPVNNFHRALLQAREKSRESHVPEVAASTQGSAMDLMVWDSPAISPVVVTPVRAPSPPVAHVSSVLAPEPKAEEPQLLVASPGDQNELSIIAEDEEPERSRASMQGPAAAQTEVAEQLPTQVDLSKDLDTIVASSSSTATFQTIPLSPTQPVDSSNAVSSTDSYRRSQSSASPDVASHPPPPPDSQAQFGNYTAPLPEIPPWHPRETHHDLTEPLPPLPAVAETPSNVEMVDVVPRPTSPKGLTHKASVPSFPSLPAPLPFRKSIRAPESSAPYGPLGTATPGGALGGKRTSWLAKAREVKALEITVKKPLPAPSVAPGVPSGNKRKSGDMFGTSGITGLEEEERRPKAAKNVDGDVAPTKPKTPDSAQPQPDQDAEMQPHTNDGEQEGLLFQLKRTVDGLGARFGKSMGKSLGGAAALAEARAAAEVRLAERHHKEEEATMALGAPSVAPSRVASIGMPAPDESTADPVRVSHPSGSQPRLSLSDLTTFSESKGKGKEVSKAAVQTSKPLPSVPPPHDNDLRDKSTTTTPPDSPSPAIFHMAPAPVFNKPPPVFVPPAPAPAPAPTLNQATTFKLPTTAFSMPASMTLGLASRLPSPKQAVPLSAQSTLESMQSDTLFDSQESVPAWMPSTQDTEYTSGFGSQSQCSPPHGPMTELDEDDSWPLDEKLAVGVQWFNVNNGKEDSLTWSTLPTQSQRGDTGPMPQDDGPGPDESRKHERDFHPIPGSFHMDMDEDEDEDEDEGEGEGEGDGDIAFDQSVLGEMEIDFKKSTVSLVDPMAGRSESQMSMASSASSQSQGGFLGHASKLMNSVLGTSKKGKPEVKSLQLAAVAAKKQQEEKEKKANRLKEMENRRQAALQRKADEEKAKAQDEERRLKEESERRKKKDREEHTDKRPLLKSVGAKKEEDTGKKRKIVGEVDKKPELKKPMPKSTPAASTSSKLPSKSTLTKPPSALASSATYNAASTSKIADGGVPKSSTLQGKGKLLTKNMVPDDDVSQPSQILQTQMAARAKAQLQAANLAPPTVSSESIELPDINSEYSDSDDEDRPRTFDPPSWAQSPDLRQALEVQSTINPDDIFGAVRPLKMDELFRNRTGRFRARTSSANWTGTDRLTAEEEREYARRMGFR